MTITMEEEEDDDVDLDFDACRARRGGAPVEPLTYDRLVRALSHEPRSRAIMEDLAYNDPYFKQLLEEEDNQSG